MRVDSLYRNGYGKVRQEFLAYDDLRIVIQKVKMRSVLQKDILPHPFSYSLAMKMAFESLPVQIFTKNTGLSSNKMAVNYMHLDSKLKIKAILKAQGIHITD